MKSLGSTFLLPSKLLLNPQILCFLDYFLLRQHTNPTLLSDTAGVAGNVNKLSWHRDLMNQMWQHSWLRDKILFLERLGSAFITVEMKGGVSHKKAH